MIELRRQRQENLAGGNKFPERTLIRPAWGTSRPISTQAGPGRGAFHLILLRKAIEPQEAGSDKGLTETIAAGPEVKRFNELKVGDKVTFRYYESVVYSIQPPGSAPPVAATTGMVRNTGPRPGGTMSEQQTVVVTIQAIDLAIPSVTIKTEKGETMSFKVEDKKNMEGVKVGDKVQITYTRALAISVETPKK